MSKRNFMLKNYSRCPKCGETSGDAWWQCEGSCPLPFSPHFKQAEADKYEGLK